jgi:hypothetical protein
MTHLSASPVVLSSRSLFLVNDLIAEEQIQEKRKLDLSFIEPSLPLFPNLNPEKKKNQSEAGSARLYIRDNQGFAWTFEPKNSEWPIKEGRIVAVKDLIQGVLQSGYPCNSWEEGIQILNIKGFINGEEESFGEEEVWEE